MHFVYSAALAILFLLTLPFWAVQSLRHGKYREGLAQRFGRVPEVLQKSSQPGTIWVHAVSVGEVLAVSSLIREMQTRWPGRRVVISTTTATGQKLARERFGAKNVFYFPLDFAFAVRPYLLRLCPELVIVAETEFWPNFLRLASKSGAHLTIVNARVSDRSLPRYRALRRFVRHVLEPVELFLAQSEEDARRLVEIGANAGRVKVSGNLKFDITRPSPPAVVEQLRAAFERGGAGPIIVCGSTVEGEEPGILTAFKSVLEGFPQAVMVLAPRHPDRFDQVAELVAASGLQFWRRTRWDGDRTALAGGVFLLDNIGELASIYDLADAAFIGGSLVPRGGHNILEPAQCGVPILVGPYTENFRDIIELFHRANAVLIVEPGALGVSLVDLLSNYHKRIMLGRRAAEVFSRNSGATTCTMNELQKLLAPQSSPGKKIKEIARR